MGCPYLSSKDLHYHGHCFIGGISRFGKHLIDIFVFDFLVLFLPFSGKIISSTILATFCQAVIATLSVLLIKQNSKKLLWMKLYKHLPIVMLSSAVL